MDSVLELFLALLVLFGPLSLSLVLALLGSQELLFLDLQVSLHVFFH